jgi:hypothetical protein
VIPWLSVSELRRHLLYKPLAILLAMLLLPVASWMESGGARRFEAQAQITNTRIIQNCLGPICSDLVQLENDAVNAYLGLHNLPTDDKEVHIIYNYGRADLRNAIRGVMFTTLMGIIGTPASERDGHQQNLYNWLQGLVQQNETAAYTLAYNHFLAWQNDPCHFTLDADLASQYDISYDGTPFCFNTLNNLFGGPPVPAGSYFTAYGLKYSYGKPALTFPYFASLVADTGVHVADVVAMGATASALIITAVDLAILPTVLAAVFAANTATLGIFGAAELAADVATALSGVGAVAIVIAAIAIGVAAGIQVFSNQQTINDLNNLKNTLAQVTSTPPDLLAFANDSSGLGMYKLQTTFDAQTVPDVPSTAMLPAHVASDLNFAIQKSTETTPTVSSTLAYQDWNGIHWEAQTYVGWFVQTCKSGASCPQADSIIAVLRYVDWSGVNWTANRVGNKFLHRKNKPASTDEVCPPDPTTGVTIGSDFSQCKSYVSTSIPLQDPNGVLETVSLSVLAPPVFTSPLTLPFTPSVASTLTITASGNPTPQICYDSSSPILPSPDFSFNGGTCGTGTFQLQFNGNAASPDQTYQLTLAASNGTTTNPVKQTFQIEVSPHLMITSPAVLEGTAGVPVNFLVTTTGSPAPSLSVDPELLQGVLGITFKDNGNGTGTSSGTSATPVSQECISGIPGGTCGIHASSTQGTVAQHFIIKLASAPPAFLGPPSSATFIAGAPNAVTLTSTGAVTPVTWRFDTSAPSWPSWLTPIDNGDGTATLTGTPLLNVTGTFNPFLGPGAYGSIPILRAYPVNVVNIPVFFSPNTATFTVGTQGSFLVRANRGAIGLVDILPTGLSFYPGNTLQCLLFNIVGACLTGTPAAGTGGQHILTLTDDAGNLGSTSQSLTVNIYEAPQITSPDSATFFTGMPGSFRVTTTGFPSLSTQPVPPNSTPPTSPNDGKGMYFTVTGLPAGLQFSNLTPAGFASGTLTIQGTPSAGDVGTHQVQITAQNGVGSTAQQTLELDVITLTGAAPAVGTQCNGAYNGTFKGNVTVAAGQNGIFVGGGITGNVTVNGGSLALTNTKVTGNILIQGSSAFSLGRGTTIGGNLTIQNVASGGAMHQVCATAVAGNMTVSANAAPIEIGSPDASCPGNAVGGSASVTFDTAATGVYNNQVGKNLSCSINTAITGGGNSATKKTGQCATF